MGSVFRLDAAPSEWRCSIYQRSTRCGADYRKKTARSPASLTVNPAIPPQTEDGAVQWFDCPPISVGKYLLSCGDFRWPKRTVRKVAERRPSEPRYFGTEASINDPYLIIC
jgi:hypothetical protein